MVFACFPLFYVGLALFPAPHGRGIILGAKTMPFSSPFPVQFGVTTSSCRSPKARTLSGIRRLFRSPSVLAFPVEALW